MRVESSSNKETILRVKNGEAKIILIKSEDFSPAKHIDSYSKTCRCNLMTLNANLTHKELARKGVKVYDIMDQGIKCFDFEDLDGNLLNACQDGEASPYSDLNEQDMEQYKNELFYQFGGVFIPVSDIDRSIDWYSNTLGLELVEKFFWMIDETNKGIGAGFKCNKLQSNIGLIQAKNFTPIQYLAPDRHMPFFRMRCHPSVNTSSLSPWLKEHNIEVIDIKDEDRWMNFSIVDPDQHYIGVSVEK